MIQEFLNSRHFTAFLAALLLPVLAVSTMPHHAASWKPTKVTRTKLILLRSQLRNYLKTTGTPPPTLAELRLFAASEGQNFDPYDGYNQRFEYLKLDSNNFFLRSFGTDGIQNTLDVQNDYNYMTWNIEEGLGLVYRYDQAGQFQLYPSALLLGAHSPNQLWQSRIFLDKDTGERKLIVRHLNKNHLYMIAPHDRIEEYLWVPNSYQIVYTATSSRKYRDGVYLWNLQTDEVINLLDIAISESAATSTEKAFYLALAGMSVTKSTLYAYVAPRRSLQLDPTEFFNAGKVLAFRIREEGRPKLAPLTKEERTLADSPLTAKFVLQESFYNIAAGSTAQQAWLRLPLEGQIEGTLQAWQEFSVNEADTPLFAYCLWYLSLLYGEGARALGKSPEATGLRSIGAEFSKALMNFPHSPSYLRGLAEFHFQSYLNGKDLPYRISRLRTIARPDNP
jgi:hypothetical protein